jgi:hypothetical protein
MNLDNYPDLIKADGFDDAIIGVINRCGTQSLCYDQNKVIQILMQDMNEEDAWEYFHYNVAGSYVGESTPVYLTFL